MLQLLSKPPLTLHTPLEGATKLAAHSRVLCERITGIQWAEYLNKTSMAYSITFEGQDSVGFNGSPKKSGTSGFGSLEKPDIVEQYWPIWIDLSKPILPSEILVLLHVL